MTCSVPVVFIIFRRPELTARVFEAIRQAKPSQLLIIADGPKDSADAALCQQTRAIAQQVDWDCKVLHNYSSVNLGCRARVSSGLDWAFSLVEEAIILEDDCLPSSSFFAYCETLLKKYKHDTRVMHIGGHNFLCSDAASPHSYYFSGLTQVWGWASWRRAWQFYDVDMAQWPLAREKYPSLFERFGPEDKIERRRDLWDKTYRGLIDSWDYQWLFAVCSQNGLCILPKVNMISNIGFGQDATHTDAHDPRRENLKRGETTFPLTHPPLVLRDKQADDSYLGLGSFKQNPVSTRLLNWMRRARTISRPKFNLSA
ncbi:MAG: glycosyltransferase family 2 protein [Cyanobacteria bacterium J06576_12]